MEITFLGIGFDATLMMQLLERNISAHYIAISSESLDLEQYEGEKVRYICRPSVDAAALRILAKTKKNTKNSDIVFLLSEITGKNKEDIICKIAEGLENKTVISVVWYSKQKHGQQGISNTLDRLGACSSVVAIPYSKLTTLLSLVTEYVEQILRMYNLPYVNTEPEIGKRIIGEGGLLHLVHREVDIGNLNRENERFSWGMAGIGYSVELDTLLEYGHSALLHLTVPKVTPPETIQYVCEYIFSQLGDEEEFNFNISVDNELADTVIIELLVTDTVTQKETEFWF